MSMWEETLKDIGITGNQAKVYATCVGLGAKTASELAVYTGLNIPEVSQELATLQSMGVIKKIPGKIDFYIALTPRIALTGMVAEALKNKLEDLKSNIMQRAEAAIEGLSQNVATFRNKLDSSLSLYLKEVKDSSSQLLVQLLGSSKETLDRFQSDANQISQSVEQYLQQMLNDHDKDSRETIKNLIVQANGTIKTFRSDLKEIKETSQNVLSDFIEQTRITINEFQEKLESAVNDTLNTIGSRTNDVSGRATSEIIALFSDLDYAFDQSIKEVRELSLAPLTTINENAIKISKTAMSGVSEFVEELAPLTETPITNIQSINEELLMDFRNILETNQKKLFDFMKEIEGILNSRTITLRDLILDESKRVSSKIKEFLNHFQSQISSVMESYKDQAIESLAPLDRSHEILGHRVQQIISITDGHVAEQRDLSEQTTTYVSQKLEEMGASLAESVRLVGEKINNSINVLIDASQILSDSLSSIEVEQGQIIEKSLTDIFEGHSTMVKSEVDGCIREQMASVSSLQNTFRDVIDSSLQNLNQVLENQGGSLQSFENSAKQALDSVKNETLDTVKNTIRETSQELGNFLSELQKTLFQEFENRKDQMSQKLDGLYSRLSTGLSSLSSDYLSEIGETLRLAMEEFEGQSNYISGSFNRSRADVEEKLRTVSEQLTANLDSSYQELKTSLGQQRENFEKQTKSWEESLFARKTLDSDTLREKLENIERFVSGQENLLRTSLDEELQRVESELKTKGTVLEQESDSLRQKIKSSKDKALEVSRISVETLLSSINESSKNLTDNINASLEKRTQLTKKHLEDFVSNFNSDSASLKDNLSMGFTDSVAVQKSKMTNFEEIFTTAMSRMIDVLQFIEEQGGDKKKFSLGKDETAELMERVTSSKNEIMKLKNELRNVVNDLNENISLVSTNILDEMDRSLTYISESFGKKTDKTIQSLLDEDTKTREEISQTIEGTFENTISAKINNFKNFNAKNLVDFQSEMDTEIDKQLQEMQKIIDYTAGHMTGNKGNCLTLFGSIKRGISEQLEKSSEVLQNALIENYETANKISKEAQEQLGSLFDQIQGLLETSHKTVSENADAITATNLSSLQELSSNLGQAINLENIKEKLNAIESGQQSKITETVASISAQMDELLVSFKLGNDDMVNNIKKSTQEAVSNTIEHTKIILNELELKMKKITEIYQGLNTTLESDLRRILEEQQSFKEQANATFNRFLVETIQQLNEKNVYASTLQNRLASSLEDIISREKQTILSKSADVVQRIKLEREKIIGDATQQLNQVSQNLNEVLESIKTQSGGQIQSSISQFRNSVEQLSERVKGSMEESIENLRQAFADVKADTQRIVMQTRETVNKLLASKEEIQKISLESTAEVDSYTEQVTTQASTLGSQTLKQFIEEREALEGSLKSEISESVTETKQRLNNFVLGLKEILKGYVEKATRLRGTAEKDVFASMDQEFEVLRKQLSEQKEQLGDTLVKNRDEIREKQDKIQKGVGELISTLGQELPGYVEKIKFDLLSTLDRYSRESRDSAEVKLESLVAITDKPFANLESKLLDFDRELGISFEKRHSELKSKTYETLESLKDDHTAFEETVNNLYSNIEKTLDQKVEETTSSYLKEISKTITMTKINAEETERDATLALNTFTEEIPEKITEAITNTQETLKLITRIMKLSEEIEPKPFEDTERVVGREQILNLLKTLIKNTKSTITILTPTIQDVPIEDLAQIPRQRVTVITDAEGKAPPMPTPNIQLKHYPGNVYAFNRDSEEMILAVATPEPLGIYTINMELIKLLNLILQDVSARAKKI